MVVVEKHAVHSCEKRTKEQGEKKKELCHWPPQFIRAFSSFDYIAGQLCFNAFTQSEKCSLVVLTFESVAKSQGETILMKAL